MADTVADADDAPTAAEMPGRTREACGIGLLAFALMLGASLLSVQLGDGTLMGPFGASLAQAAYALAGLGSYLIVLLTGLAAVRMLGLRPLGVTRVEGAGYAAAAYASLILIHVAFPSSRMNGHSPGGVVGELSAEILRAGLSTAGTVLAALTTVVVGLVLASEVSVVQIARAAAARVAAARAARRAKMPPEPIIVSPAPVIVEPESKKKDRARAERPRPSLHEVEPAVLKIVSGAEPADDDAATLAAAEPTIVEPEYRKAKKPVAAKGGLRPMEGDFHLPDLALLECPEQTIGELDKQEMRDLAERLTKALASYGVQGHVSEIHPGPVITMYEFVMEEGTRLSKITSLPADLAMALKAARPVRIVAPLPGKGAVGIEVPNRKREMVFLKEVLADEATAHADMKLPLALGKDIMGKPVAVDLSRMPHLLVAGTTGAGKSVALNSMISSLLYAATPDKVRLILVDPKMVELSIYDGIPHLLLPVVTDPAKANLALRWAVDEMDRRYQRIFDAKVRHIEAYNAKQTDPAEKMPYLVVVIDEFADLMTTAPKEVEWSVQRLAQKARAAGIHVILATQRPSQDVITGVIKANFPVRIAFYVKDALNSRVILDEAGAETLLGDGDMLYQGKGLLQRVHGAYVSEGEVHRLVDFLKEQGAPEYNLDILKPREEESEGGAAEEGPADEKYDQAVAVVAESRQASISYVQRRLGVGYNRAAKMIERMEREGIVGPQVGVQPREVLVSP